jgi:hypothetical protein
VTPVAPVGPVGPVTPVAPVAPKAATALVLTWNDTLVWSVPLAVTATLTVDVLLKFRLALARIRFPLAYVATVLAAALAAMYA